MKSVDQIFEFPVYELTQAEKAEKLLTALNELTEYHRSNCSKYGAILAAQGLNKPAQNLSEIPFIPVRLFKLHLLESISDQERFKVLTSSGTTGQAVSRISLDRITAEYQTKAMIRIMQDFLGKNRLPMLILDHPGVIKNRANFSARGAGILGMSNFGRNPTYALFDESMDLDIDGISNFLGKWGNTPILLFGFTFMVWKYFIQALEKNGQSLNIPQGILIHSGGWKKLEDEAVDNETFKRRLADVTGIRNVHNFYGMVEQVGSIFVECEKGRLHVPSFAEVVIRRALDWSEADLGEEGIIQVLSSLPHSYPGHSLLTEDVGKLLGTDDCPCGRKGRTFRVKGRLPQAEIRGCSDSFGDR